MTAFRAGRSRSQFLATMVERQIDQRYGECSRHVQLPTKGGGKRLVRTHLREVRAGLIYCWKCAQGMKADVWPCRISDAHYHWGHRRREDDREQP